MLTHVGPCVASECFEFIGIAYLAFVMAYIYTYIYIY